MNHLRYLLLKHYTPQAHNFIMSMILAFSEKVRSYQSTWEAWHTNCYPCLPPGSDLSMMNGVLSFHQSKRISSLEGPSFLLDDLYFRVCVSWRLYKVVHNDQRSYSLLLIASFPILLFLPFPSLWSRCRCQSE